MAVTSYENANDTIIAYYNNRPYVRVLMTTGYFASGLDVCTSLVWLLGDFEEGADELLVNVTEGC